MANRNFRKGKRREYKVRDYLEKQGYYVASTGGSLGVFDIIAIPKTDSVEYKSCGYEGTRVIQVKSNRISKLERMEIEGFQVCARKEIVIIQDRCSEWLWVYWKEGRWIPVKEV